MSAPDRERRVAVGADAAGRPSGARAVGRPGGSLAVAEWGPADAPPVLAIHGITASSRAWAGLAPLVPELRIVTPDLRGRARSNGLSVDGEDVPRGLRGHVDDLRRLLDETPLDRDASHRGVPVVGHSMGAFVALLLAAVEPERVSRLVLVDGGLPLALPPGATQEQLLSADPAALLGPAFERLTRVFPTRGDYLDFWRAHPAFSGELDPHGELAPDVEAYALYDLDEVPGGFRPSSNPAAIAADQAELFGPDWYLDALRAVRQPTVVLRAPLGLLAEPPGLYAPGVLETWRRQLPQLEIVEVPEVNHYTIVMARPGADRVAQAVRSAAG